MICVRLNIGTTLRRDKLTETRRKNVETRRARRSLKCKRHRPTESERKSCYLWESSDLETTTKKKTIDRTHTDGKFLDKKTGNAESGVMCAGRSLFLLGGKVSVAVAVIATMVCVDATDGCSGVRRSERERETNRKIKREKQENPAGCRTRETVDLRDLFLQPRAQGWRWKIVKDGSEACC